MLQYQIDSTRWKFLRDLLKVGFRFQGDQGHWEVKLGNRSHQEKFCTVRKNLGCQRYRWDLEEGIHYWRNLGTLGRVGWAATSDGTNITQNPPEREQVSYKKGHRYPQSLTGIIQQEIPELLRCRIIRESKSLFNSPL